MRCPAKNIFLDLLYYIYWQNWPHIDFPTHLLLTDKPYCRPDQQDVYGVATGETVRIPCDVFGDPSGEIKFEWVFNTSTEWYPKMPESILGVTSPERGWTRAYIQHTPKVIFRITPV